MKSYYVSGMSCAGCAHKVEAALRQFSVDVVVTLEPPRAMVPFGLALPALNASLKAAGGYRLDHVSPKMDALHSISAWLSTHYPLLLIMGLIAVASLAGESWMMSFMAGFYIVFGAFKLLNVPAFADAYARYDIVAKAFRPWGYIYPFLELALGLAFLFWYEMRAASWIALVLSIVGVIGALQALGRSEKVQCACLGTVLPLPMSTVTIVENGSMALMAAWMLFVGM
jgi:hypothetical protein